MKIEGPFTLRQEQCLSRLRTMHRSELRILFKSLKPPVGTQLRGEYDAELLKQGGSAADLIIRKAFTLQGPWTGKAFTPISDTEGIGYNCFRYGPDTVGKLPLRTQLGPSQLDGGESMFIRYQELNRGAIRWLVGELRLLEDSIILGFGIFGPTLGTIRLFYRHIPFVMVGPRRDYAADAMRIPPAVRARIA